MALTLRAVGGLSTREIADAFFVPEATMAQRISRAKRTLHDRGFTEPGDLAVVLRVLSLVYHAGHGRPNDLAGEAIRLTRQLTLATTEPEARGLLALMLLQHARLPARTDADGRFVPLDEQDRSRWDTAEIAEGVAILQGALGEQRPGRYQMQAAIAALHADAATSQETDWPQILEWYDDLIALSDEPDREDPAAVLNRAVAVGHVSGAAAGLAETERVAAVLGDRAAVVGGPGLPVRAGRRLRRRRRRLRRCRGTRQRGRRARTPRPSSRREPGPGPRSTDETTIAASFEWVRRGGST